MELVLLRHAQPQWLSPQGTGVSDPGLTEEGHRRARNLASGLGQEDFQSVVVSSYRRAQETARGVFCQNPREWTTVDWVREIRLPDLSMQPAAQVADYFSSMRRRPLEDWWEGYSPEGESFKEFHARIQSGLINWLAQMGVHRTRGDMFTIDESLLGSKHLVISHLGSTGLILSELLHIELVPWVWDSFALDWNGAVRLETTPIAEGYIFSLRVFNENGHRDPTLGYRKRTSRA